MDKAASFCEKCPLNAGGTLESIEPVDPIGKGERTPSQPLRLTTDNGSVDIRRGERSKTDRRPQTDDEIIQSLVNCTNGPRDTNGGKRCLTGLIRAPRPR